MRKHLILPIVMWMVIMVNTPGIMARSDCTKTVPQLFKQISPSVVFISAVSFDPFKPKDRVTTSIGSGFIIGKDGLILTNSHLVFGHQTISVTLDDGTMVQAELVGIDPILDLALLRIPVSTKGLSVATLGDSEKVEIGEEVMAIGNPFGLEQTLTVGVVSGINRTLPTAPMSLRLPLIQTDAAINPGNSGGPLVNRCGEVIGINTAMLGPAENIGFAVPINVAKQIIPQLLEKGRVIRPWLGVSGKFVQKELGEIINLPFMNGFMVEMVEPESPAERAGLNEGDLPVTIGGTEFMFGGDIIIAVNGGSFTGPGDLAKLVDSLKVGDHVRLTLFHRGETREIELRLTERPILPSDFQY
ncbi:MAG: trypsin-like peptidase domain-containing protein [Deltaproteobacteria bacterium]|nr:MAG: trypsin-like peptidase domain-containing protein [Deltaproteobacteria bacterium]